jgi:hypothetical protein
MLETETRPRLRLCISLHFTVIYGATTTVTATAILSPSLNYSDETLKTSINFYNIFGGDYNL